MEESADCLCLDVRAPANAAPFVERYGDRWLNIPQETLNKRMDEVPRDKRLLLMCNSGARSYEAMRQLDRAGIDNTVNVQGGAAMLKKSGTVGPSAGIDDPDTPLPSVAADEHGKERSTRPGAGGTPSQD